MHSNRVNDTSPPTGGRSNYLRCGVTRRRACRRRRIICGLRDRQLDKSARARCASARAKRWPGSASAGGEGRRRYQARRIAQTRSPASCPRPRPSSCDETNAICGTRPEEFGSRVPRRFRSEVQGLGRVLVCPVLLFRVSSQDTCGPLQLRTAISSGVCESRCEPIEHVQPSPESAPSAASRCSGATLRLRAGASSVSSRGSRLSVTVREQQATCEHVDFIGLSPSAPLPGPKWPTCSTTGGVFLLPSHWLVH